MKLPELSKSVIVIDTNFLIQIIRNNHDFYSKEYPNHKFNKINILKVIQSIALTSRAIKEENETISVIFFFMLNNSKLPLTSEPNDVHIFNDFVNRPLMCQIDNCIFNFSSFYADPESNDKQLYNKELGQLLLSIASKEQTSNISIIVDDIFFEDTFLRFNEIFNKKFVIFRSSESEMFLPDPPKFWNVNLDYIIAREMGVADNEL